MLGITPTNLHLCIIEFTGELIYRCFEVKEPTLACRKQWPRDRESTGSISNRTKGNGDEFQVPSHEHLYRQLVATEQVLQNAL
jgi:hypothetical protein